VLLGERPLHVHKLQACIQITDQQFSRQTSPTNSRQI
jgi:hypothetical protein